MDKLRKIIRTTITEYLNNDEQIRLVTDDKNHKFKLYFDNVLVSESGFSVESPDEWFNQSYLTLFNLKTHKDFQGKGYAKLLLEQIFKYVKDKLNFDIITIIVYKDNHKALNLYFNSGFEIYIEYEDSYSLIKRL